MKKLNCTNVEFWRSEDCSQKNESRIYSDFEKNALKMFQEDLGVVQNEDIKMVQMLNFKEIKLYKFKLKLLESWKLKIWEWFLLIEETNL